MGEMRFFVIFAVALIFFSLGGLLVISWLEAAKNKTEKVWKRTKRVFSIGNEILIGCVFLTIFAICFLGYITAFAIKDLLSRIKKKR